MKELDLSDAAHRLMLITGLELYIAQLHRQQKKSNVNPVKVAYQVQIDEANVVLSNIIESVS